MKRWLIAVVCLGIAATGLVTVPNVAAGAKPHRISPGLVVVDGTSSMTIDVYNPTGTDRSVQVQLDEVSGFSGTFSASFPVPAHQDSSASFTCAATGSCAAVPIVTGPAVLLPTARFIIPSDTTTFQIGQVPAGGWRPA